MAKRNKQLVREERRRRRAEKLAQAARQSADVAPTSAPNQPAPGPATIAWRSDGAIWSVRSVSVRRTYGIKRRWRLVRTTAGDVTRRWLTPDAAAELVRVAGIDTQHAAALASEHMASES
jgi:hypothetical protein